MPENQSLEIHFDYTFGNQTEELFYKFSGQELSPSPESLVAAKLLPSMFRSEDLHIEEAIDPFFLNSLTDIQHLYKAWSSDYKIIQIDAPKKLPATQASHKRRCATFFSGGADSFYTLLKHQEEITDLIFVHGLDIPLENTKLRAETREMLERVAAHFHVNLIEVVTNVRPLLTPYAEWGRFAHGAALASIGLLLQNSLSTIYIPSSYTYQELFPWGTHPLLDHLWSTKNLQFIHDGCEASRNQKMALLSQHDIVLNSLRVCWLNPDGAYNCGKCSKCIRAMVCLEVNNVLEKCTTFNGKLDLKAVARLKLKTPNIRAFAMDHIATLEKSGEHEALKNALKKAVRVRNFKKLFKKRYR